LLAVVLLLSLAGRAEAAFMAGEQVATDWTVREDLYAAGRDVAVRGEVQGDLVATAGRVLVEQPVRGDLTAAAGDVDVRAAVGDDARLAGGRVTVAGPIAGDLVAAGGFVVLAPGAEVRGRAALAGGTVEVGGRIRGSVRAAGRTVRLAGQIDGNVDVAAGSVEVLETARVGGRLTYRSGSDARIAPGAAIAGGTTRRMLEMGERVGRVARILAWLLGVALLLALVLVGVVLVALFPEGTRAAARRIATDPGKSLLAGLLVLLGAPVAIGLLMVTLVGIPLGLGLLALFCLWLLVGFLIAALFLGDLGVRGLGLRPSRGWRLLGLLLSLMLLALLQAVPLMGSLALAAALVFGVGAWSLHVSRGYRESEAPPA